jgi:hypothetical protein
VQREGDQNKSALFYTATILEAVIAFKLGSVGCTLPRKSAARW